MYSNANVELSVEYMPKQQTKNIKLDKIKHNSMIFGSATEEGNSIYGLIIF